MTEFESRALALLERIAQALERKAPRDERHAALVAAIATAAGSAAFTSAELIAHAQVEGALRSAILASCGMNTRALGRLLRRIEGVEMGGMAIERCADSSDGVIWLARPRKPRLSIA